MSGYDPELAIEMAKGSSPLHNIVPAVLRRGVHVSFEVQMVVGPTKILKPFFVRAVWPFPQRKARCRSKKK
jgi:hypothetical protein